MCGVDAGLFAADSRHRHVRYHGTRSFEDRVPKAGVKLWARWEAGYPRDGTRSVERKLSELTAEVVVGNIVWIQNVVTRWLHAILHPIHEIVERLDLLADGEPAMEHVSDTSLHQQVRFALSRHPSRIDLLHVKRHEKLPDRVD